MSNRKGFSLIELVVVLGLGLFILIAAFFLHTGSIQLFKDSKTMADNIQGKIPSIELIARYFDRWGVGVVSMGAAGCSSYPPQHSKCVTMIEGNPCDEVTFWGSIHGTGVVRSTSSPASVLSCRLNTGTGQNCYYVWRNNALLNTISGTTVTPVALAGLSVQDADCSGLTAPTPTSALSNATMDETYGSITLEGGDFINRAPHRIRLYCGANANDGGNRWLLADISDTSSCSLNQTAVPVAPVESFQIVLQPSVSCNAAAGECAAIKVTTVFRSESKNNRGQPGVYTVERVFGR